MCARIGRGTDSVKTGVASDRRSIQESAVPSVLGRHRRAEADRLQNRGPLRPGRQPLPPEARPDRHWKLLDA